MKKFYLTLFYVFCILFLNYEISSSDIYKWVDKNGETHFTNVPNHDGYKRIIKTRGDFLLKDSKNKFSQIEINGLPSDKKEGRMGAKRISGALRFGCISKDTFSKNFQYLLQGNRDAFTQSLAEDIYFGTCTQLNNGETVYLVDTELFSGLVKVRRPNDFKEYWTITEAVK